MSLRLRLTLWYTALLLVLLTLIAFMSLSLVRTSTLTRVDEELRDRGGQVARVLAYSLPSSSLTEVLLSAVGTSFDQELYVQVLDREKRIVYRSSRLASGRIPLPEAYYQQALSGASGYYSLSVRGPDDLRVYYQPITFNNEIVGAVLVARSLAFEQQILRQLAKNFAWIILIALIVGASVGYWLAGAALRPIQEATATALAITRTGRLDARVPISGARSDEIGTLINTFNEMLGRLQELFERERRFSGDISHELRSPLTTILGNLSLLKRADALPETERAEMLAEIETEAQRMRRLISDLLLLAQADADPTVAHKPVELDTLMLEVYRQAKRRATGREFRIVHEDQAIVMGDAERLRQMLVNLVNNAIQYTPEGGRIELSLQRKGDYAEIQVRDTGRGIAQEDLPYIFQRFYRADKARSRQLGGTGLGLSIVKWVVDAHAGVIEVESELDVGTTFRVRLPLAPTGEPARGRKEHAT
ncbi:MAG: HAMP domain-containing protein [Chloroflexi bacterium]|nr:HAMP domain-containing protein [Chloroflexota bacterium]